MAGRGVFRPVIDNVVVRGVGSDHFEGQALVAGAGRGDAPGAVVGAGFLALRGPRLRRPPACAVRRLLFRLRWLCRRGGVGGVPAVCGFLGV